jgi:hypothetical protein
MDIHFVIGYMAESEKNKVTMELNSHQLETIKSLFGHYNWDINIEARWGSSVFACHHHWLFCSFVMQGLQKQYGHSFCDWSCSITNPGFSSSVSVSGIK